MLRPIQKVDDTFYSLVPLSVRVNVAWWEFGDIPSHRATGRIWTGDCHSAVVILVAADVLRPLQTGRSVDAYISNHCTSGNDPKATFPVIPCTSELYCKRSFPRRVKAGSFHSEDGIRQPQYHINPLLLLRPYIIRLLYGQDSNNVLIDFMNISISENRIST